MEHDRYAIGLGLISLSALLFVWWIVSNMASYEDVDEQNTIARSGILSRDPTFDSIVVDGKKQYYCELAFRGSDDVYWFIECSYREGVEKQLVKLFQGDSVMLHVQQRNNTIYEVRDAHSANYRLRYYFSQYNRCAEQDVPLPNPWFAEIVLVLGILLVIKEYYGASRDEQLAETSTEAILEMKIPIKLTSDPFIYVMRTMTYPLITLGLAAYFVIVESGEKAFAGYFLLAISCGLFINNILIATTMTYVIDEEGVEATTDSLFSKKSATKIKFKDIDDVSNITSFFERRRKVGTIRLSKHPEADEQPLNLIGIRNHLEVGKLIFDLATTKRVGKE